MSRNRKALAAGVLVAGLGGSVVGPVAGAVAGGAPAHTAAAGPSARTAAARATIDLKHTKLGTLLVNSRGFTVYAFALDHGRRDACVSIADCTKVWPPVLTNGTPRAGTGVKRSLLGTTRIPGGEQVTYAGHPLYTYVADRAPGSTYYVGINQFGGRWPGVRPSGAMVK